GAPPGERRGPARRVHEDMTEKFVGQPVGFGRVRPEIEQVVFDAFNACDDPRVFLPIRSLQPPVDSERGEQMRREYGTTVTIVPQVEPATLAPLREHLVERGVKFLGAVNAR